MKMRNVKIFVLAILGGCLLLGRIFILPVFQKDSSQRVLNGEGYYSIDSQTIMKSLGDGNRNVFTLVTTTPVAESIIRPPVQWTQADFIQIADSFLISVWNESLENWFIKEIIFSVDCTDVNFGPQRMGFVLYKIIQGPERESRIERYINIDPRENQISWYEEKIFPAPVLSSWKSIDLDRVSFSFEQTLDIAEAQGGQKSRIDTENNCGVIGILTYSGKYNDWVFSYQGDIGTLIRVTVDEFTGDHKIIYKKEN